MKNLVLTFLATIFLSVATFAQNTPAYVTENGLVGWWPFSGNANDFSVNANHGSVSGATLTTDRFGVANMAYNFLQYQKITIPHSTSFATIQNLSFSFWVYPVSNSLTLLRKGIYYGVDFGNNTNTGAGLYLVFFLPNTFSSNPLPINTWHHIVVTRDGVNRNIYVNGVLNSTSIYGTNISYNEDVFTIGSWNNELINAKIDDIGIWNRALTLKEINDLYFGCQPSVAIQPTNQTAFINNNAQLTLSSSDTAATFQWQTNLGLGFQNITDIGQYSGALNDTLTVSNLTMGNNNHTFRCIVNQNTCPDTSNTVTLTVIDNTGISDNDQETLFTVYPNPTENVINVKADPKLVGSVYTVYDNVGKIILSGTLQAEITVIELSNLSGGIYLFRVGDTMKQTFKVIKK